MKLFLRLRLQRIGAAFDTTMQQSLFMLGLDKCHCYCDDPPQCLIRIVIVKALVGLSLGNQTNNSERNIAFNCSKATRFLGINTSQLIFMPSVPKLKKKEFWS